DAHPYLKVTCSLVSKSHVKPTVVKFYWYSARLLKRPRSDSDWHQHCASSLPALEETNGGIYDDTQAVCLDDGCWTSLWIYGDALRAHAHRSPYRSFLFPKFGHVEAWERGYCLLLLIFYCQDIFLHV